MLKGNFLILMCFRRTSADKYITAIRENNGKVKDLLKEKKTIMKSIEADPEAADVGSKLDKSFEIDSRIIETRKVYIVFVFIPFIGE